MKFVVSLNLALITLLKIILAQESSSEVKISTGVLKGVYRHSWKGKAFRAFTGIPYAKPPIDDLRFEAPVPAEPWDGILDASKSPSQCVQVNVFLNDFNPQGDEDCLYLNVYTPSERTSKLKKLPVMFFIHGGGWTSGNGNAELYGPDYLMDKDIVLVTINYRLGAFGFLSTEDSLLPGNNGLKDQVLALKWVQRNIKYFDGDPKKVTLFGQSAGGASVVFHLLSPLSRGLFFGAIAQSGSALASWALAIPGRMANNTKRLTQFLNCPSDIDSRTIECLKKVHAYDIVNQDRKFYEFSYDPIAPFMPVIEVEGEGAFLTEHPMNLMKIGKMAKVPFMTGITSEDGAIRSSAFYNDSAQIERLNREFNNLLPLMFAYEDTASLVARSARKYYLGNSDIDETTKDKLTELLTDYYALLPVDTTVRRLAKHLDQTFYYLFGYRGSISMTSIFGDTSHNYGVCHGDEMFYLLSNKLFDDRELTYEDSAMRELIVTLWTNFAKFGTPTPKIDSIVSTIWNPATSDKGNYYHIKSPSDVSMNINLYEERMVFWHNVWKKQSLKLEL